MSGVRITKAEEQRILELCGDGMTPTAIGREVGRPRVTVRDLLIRHDKLEANTGAGTSTPSEKIVDGPGGVKNITTLGGVVRTVEQARMKGGVDGPEWRVRRAEVTHWEVGMKGPDGRAVVTPLWRVFVSVEPIGQNELQLEVVCARTVAQIAEHIPVYDVTKYPAAERVTGRMLELDVLDAHVGMYAWAGEAGKSYDVEIAGTVFMQTVERLLTAAGRYPVECVVLPVGNDFFHADTEGGTTTSEKVKVDVDTRATRVFEQGKLLLVRVIDRLLTVAPVVKVPIVPGNHDRLSVIHLGHVLAAWYRGTSVGDRVQVDFSAPSRKYVRWGKALLGYEHGGDVKRDRLPLIMAFERPKDWAETEHRRWRVGHLHHRSQTIVASDVDIGCVEVYQSRALCPSDAWHSRKGFVGVPNGGSATVWDRTDGVVAEFSVNVR